MFCRVSMIFAAMMALSVSGMMLGACNEVSHQSSFDDCVQVTAGCDHSCCLHEDGHVSCWGDNSDGEFPPSDVFDIVQVEAACNFTCTLHEAGNIDCVGVDAFCVATRRETNVCFPDTLFRLQGMISYKLTAIPFNVARYMNLTASPAGVLITRVAPCRRRIRISFLSVLAVNIPVVCVRIISECAGEMILSARQLRLRYTETRLRALESWRKSLRAVFIPACDTPTITTVAWDTAMSILMYSVTPTRSLHRLNPADFLPAFFLNPGRWNAGGTTTPDSWTLRNMRTLSRLQVAVSTPAASGPTVGWSAGATTVPASPLRRSGCRVRIFSVFCFKPDELLPFSRVYSNMEGCMMRKPRNAKWKRKVGRS